MSTVITMKIMNDFDRIEKIHNVRIPNDLFFNTIDVYLNKFGKVLPYVQFIPDRIALDAERSDIINGTQIDMRWVVGKFVSYDKDRFSMDVKLDDRSGTIGSVIKDIIKNNDKYGLYVHLIGDGNLHPEKVLVLDKQVQLKATKFVILPKYLIT